MDSKILAQYLTVHIDMLTKDKLKFSQK